LLPNPPFDFQPRVYSNNESFLTKDDTHEAKDIDSQVWQCFACGRRARGNWHIIASPNGSRQVNELHGVSALSENDVWAVGVSYNIERTLGSTLIEHWNGSHWSVVPSPNPSSSVNQLNAVAAVSPNDVWAVGTAPTPMNTVLILHWNGAAWSVMPNPTNGIPLGNLAALAVISANDMWAVGSGFIGDESATATLHWNGTAWSVIPSPNVGPEVDNSLAGVATVSSNDVWAVGTQQPTNLTDPSTLILHWTASLGLSCRM
jgi:hypothetical protein